MMRFRDLTGQRFHSLLVLYIWGRTLNWRERPYGTASIDRIDSSKGYEEGNIQWVHKDVNFMKRTYTMGYFIEMCSKIVQHSLNKDN